MTSGTAQFHVPGLSEPCQTWYKVFGDLKTDATPLIVLHGGPGACHEYLLPLTDLSHSRPVIFYDQIGNGASTHLPDKNGDEAFWTVKLFKNELDNLLSHLKLNERPIDVLGHSWGGMLAAEWAAGPSADILRRLVIVSSPASIDVWRTCLSILKARLPEDVQKALDRAEKNKDFESPEYEAAVEVFYKKHVSLTRPWPAKEVQVALDWFAKDSTTYGPSEITITGSLRDWTSVSILHKITVPTLLMNGAEDEAQDVAMQPFFDHIEKVKWITIDDAAHFVHVDQREKFMRHLEAFLSA
ncbi:Peptidase S33 tricorn interacting factor 1 protein [Rutstroemia sp. NJR-2017a BBW]|nr:Peptidase S33 tricorn interacting factor 1 protein [Rutstroemia sp. NJR-2017a BBW]